ncbi:hypothetical protein OGR47_21085 (plasmid) [Methylocystis sp. MJC1]|uniref:hypothetical protein n=1 Tax=Methylocystis sp. MJC1 TaxID=2654282 RepID=UPI0013EA535A|nr:hypothetical protein [Methylocystis sp. MJC1]KAF2988838.1 hypothetical protein MJC1_04082 [Methylocystis sp. MJC1]MBU6529390.1 hypothetical protein [Methylocystis sp. MJC1]UZX14126.1 hypothetical protein OGR47_21085 [Methylocystis sp. MJC1]
MSKLILPAISVLAILWGPAFAANQNWNITEEGVSGIKAAQGTWSVNTDADKITGTANLQLGNGNPLTYKISGSVKDSTYTIEMSDRTDGKKGCVWNGHVPTGADKSHGLIGQAVCEGKVKLIIRAGF